jgi:hypothetical protein
MKKFSKLTENIQFLGYSKDRILNEFKSHLNPEYINIDMIYISKGVDCSDVINDIGEIERYHLQDAIFSPMFYIDLILGTIPKQQDHHEINGLQVDNWVDESIKFDLISNEFIKLSSFLEKYKNDFNISLETSGGNLKGNSRYRTNSFISYNNGNLNILNITISLLMKDYFEYDQIK